MVSAMNRRVFLRGAGLAAGAMVGGAALSSCAGAGQGPGNQNSGGEVTYKFDDAANPFGLTADKPGEVVIPDQGWGEVWIEEQIAEFTKLHAGVTITKTAHKDMNVTIQPRFIQGDPPDLIMPAGIQVKTLVEQGQLFDLSEFYKAPAFDGGGTIADSLLPGTMEAADFLTDGHQLIAPYTFTSYGIWYQGKIFEQNGWVYPKTWDEMITLCGEIKKTGIAPWAYAGKYAGYLFTPMQNMAAKAGGVEWILAVDNLEPNAWKADNFLAAAEGIEEMRAKGYFLKGTEGLSHTESQTLWAQNKAAMIPCGGWLENESEASIDAANMIKMAPTPSLTSSDALPFEALAAYPGNQVFVPAKAKNKQFALEFLRYQWSKQGSAIWTKNTKSFTSLKGYYDNLADVPSGLQSQIEALKGAGDNILPPAKYGSYYPDLTKFITDKTGLLGSGTMTAKEYVDAIQGEADRIAKDPNVKKHTRELK